MKDKIKQAWNDTLDRHSSPEYNQGMRWVATIFLVALFINVVYHLISS